MSNNWLMHSYKYIRRKFWIWNQIKKGSMEATRKTSRSDKEMWGTWEMVRSHGKFAIYFKGQSSICRLQWLISTTRNLQHWNNFVQRATLSFFNRFFFYPMAWNVISLEDGCICIQIEMSQEIIGQAMCTRQKHVLKCNVIKSQFISI